jgi:hypothetical protein
MGSVPVHDVALKRKRTAMETPHEHDEPSAAPSTAEPRNAFLEEKAFKSRTVLLFGAISDQSASDIARRLIALDAENDKPIDMLVSSPGGHLESGDAIHDIIRFIGAPVNMIGTGWVGSAATHLYLAVPGAPLLHAQHPLPDPPAQRRRRRAGQRHRDPRAGDHQGARTHRPDHRPRDRQAAGQRAAGHRARPLAVGRGSDRVRPGRPHHQQQERPQALRHASTKKGRVTPAFFLLASREGRRFRKPWSTSWRPWHRPGRA